jgi:flagellar basal-body rod protein FlgB
MNLIDNALGVHAQALGLRSKRMEVLARNIANADTPHFKAKDVDFRSVLKQTQEATLNTTSNLHMALPMEENPGGEKYRIPFNAAFDGNTVEMNIEQAKFGQVAADYQTTLNILENRVSGIRRALRGD